MTFGDFWSGPYKVARDRWKPSTIRRCDSAYRTQLAPAFGHVELRAITHRAVKRWFDGYSVQAPIGANRALQVLASALNWAEVDGLVSRNHARRIVQNPVNKRTRFLTMEEIRRLRTALAAHRSRSDSGRQQVAIIELLLLTGCRKSEIVNLQWSEVAENEIRLVDSKVGPRSVPLNSHARGIIERQQRTCAYVFPVHPGVERPRTDELSVWRRVRQTAGIPDVRLHDLRHTFASHAVMSGVPLPVVSRLLGHASIAMTARYAHVADAAIERSAAKIEKRIVELMAATE